MWSQGGKEDWGFYTARSASRLLGVTERQIISWTSEQRERPAIFEPTYPWAYSFHDLVTLGVVAVLRGRGIELGRIIAAHQDLQHSEGLDRPFAHEQLVARLATAGNSIVEPDSNLDRSQGGQFFLLATIEELLVPIDYDGITGMAASWTPTRGVSLRPNIQAGAPCIEGRRIPTSVIADRLEEGETVEDVAEDLDLIAEQVADAWRFEYQIRHGGSLIAVAAA